MRCSLQQYIESVETEYKDCAIPVLEAAVRVIEKRIEQLKEAEKAHENKRITY